MTSYKLPKEDLIKHLHKQLGFLKNSCAAYDKGFEDEACRIAVAIRILLHDTKNSHSLLQSLAIKGKIDYWNSAAPIDPRNLISSTQLVILQAKSDGQGSMTSTYQPRLDDGLTPFKGDWQSYQYWWSSQGVLKDNKKKEFTRKDLVLLVANKDGGAHVDTNLDQEYAELLKFNSAGWVKIVNGVETPFDNDPVYASVRQIGHELLKTLEKVTF